MDIKYRLSQYQQVRALTEKLCEPLEIEDYVIQSIEAVSPPKWHLGHTTWFFEVLILKEYDKRYQDFDKSFQTLFNSYYKSLGVPYPRQHRGCLSRPTCKKVYEYRAYVDHAIEQFLQHCPDQFISTIDTLIELGIQHEQQHQELLLMDIKHNHFIQNAPPLYSYTETPLKNFTLLPPSFIENTGGIVQIGAKENAFSYDNEKPKHTIYLDSYAIASRLVSQQEYQEFIEDKGYETPTLWLDAGWNWLQSSGVHAPLYWIRQDKNWCVFTLHGVKKLEANVPVSHISYYEADAFAKWAGKRLPTEFEWEHFANHLPATQDNPQLLESDYYHPKPMQATSKPQQFIGTLWEWTMSPYGPYPGYKPYQGPLGEYNHKFMLNQMVLRGGCCVSPQSHVRISYRNFFYPHDRWQFSGIRLASNV